MSGYSNIVDIVGFEGRYAITDTGMVWSYPKKSNNNSDGRWLKISTSGMYPKVGLYDSSGKCSYLNVHRLLAETFIPNPDSMNEVNHINGDKSDYRLSNLEWVTTSDNASHKWQTGLASVTDRMRESAKQNIQKHNMAKRRLTDSQVKKLRQDRIHNMSWSELSAKYEISVGSARDIVSKRSYKEIA